MPLSLFKLKRKQRKQANYTLTEEILSGIVSSWIRNWETTAEISGENRWILDFTKLVVKYAKLTELFDKNKLGQFIIYDFENNILEDTVSEDIIEYRTSYCKHIITSEINNHHWRIKVLNFVSNDWSIVLGISELSSINCRTYLKGYGASFHDEKRGTENLNNYLDKIGPFIKSDYIIDFYLDFKDNALDLLVNNSPYGNLLYFKNKLHNIGNETKWLFGVTMFYGKSKLQMIEYNYKRL